MKIALSDLKKAIKKVEEISLDTHLNIKWVDNMVIMFNDKYGAQVEITLFSDSTMMPKIRKEDTL